MGLKALSRSGFYGFWNEGMEFRAWELHASAVSSGLQG